MCHGFIEGVGAIGWMIDGAMVSLLVMLVVYVICSMLVEVSFGSAMLAFGALDDDALCTVYFLEIKPKYWNHF